jgi:hypothetical protein
VVLKMASESIEKKEFLGKMYVKKEKTKKTIDF